MRLAGDLIGDVDEHGEPILGDTIFVLLNAHHESIPFCLPTTKPEHHWERLLDTADVQGEQLILQGGQGYQLQARSLALFVTRLAHETGQPVSAVQARTLRKEARRPAQPMSHLMP
jgi:glycogen operon protein